MTSRIRIAAYGIVLCIVGVAGCGSNGGGGTISSGGTAGSAGAGGSSAGGSSAGGSSAGGTGNPGDPFDAARQACIDHINELRATKGRAPYQRWTAAESCVDEQATYDSTNGPHAAYNSGNSCDAGGQGECPGQGPESAVSCVDLMWAEGDQEICSGCDECPSLGAGFNGECAGCQVSTSSPTCGHYLALVVSSFTAAACGFSTAGAYMAIDYQ